MNKRVPQFEVYKGFDCILIIGMYVLTPTLMQLMEDYMPPPPAATCLAFHPLDNNIIAIGMEDSIIQIFNIQLTKVLWIHIFPCSA